MPKVAHKGIEFDSAEEVAVYEWLLEAKEAGLVADFDYHPDSIQIYNDVKEECIVDNKVKPRHLLRGLSYTMDFAVIFKDSIRMFDKLPIKLLRSSYDETLDHYILYIDIKGTYSIYNDNVKFSVIQKALYDKKGIFVQKVIPQKLFLATWVPEHSRLSPKLRQPVKKYIKCITIKEVKQLLQKEL